MVLLDDPSPNTPAAGPDNRLSRGLRQVLRSVVERLNAHEHELEPPDGDPILPTGPEVAQRDAGADALRAAGVAVPRPVSRAGMSLKQRVADLERRLDEQESA